MNLALDTVSRDPVLREHAERRRLEAKRDAAAAKLRESWSPSETLEAAARDDLARWAARQPTETAADDYDIDVDDLDADLVGPAAIADARRTRLRQAIDSTFEAGYRDLLERLSPEFRAEIAPDHRPDLDRRRVRAELGGRPEAPTVDDEPPVVLTGSALIEAAAREDLPRLLAPKRTRRR